MLTGTFWAHATMQVLGRERAFLKSNWNMSDWCWFLKAVWQFLTFQMAR